MTMPPGPPPQDPNQPGYGQQPYGYGPPPGYPPYGYRAPDHPQAAMSMILGILGIVACGVIAPFAWSMGKKTVAEIDASGGQLGGRSQAQAGYVCGIVGTVILAVGLILIVLYVVFFLAIFGASMGAA
jgi:uncharacterized membrane protein YjgN (DUF898 family)